ncbi:glycosyltransferase [Bradyrhizobium sp. CB3481]|uniref:glycosyltransferase n=1 Tax=Bradyrhizobium sp. CB3481 TaxID=3039158 RepID=UPI0024B05E3D|nr:glycosyltransferase [Bradyrhizobium sp. CB3481]WFU18963.1 glycosyltransferase [Bradyrhizobium sp. CB3481]
MTTAADRRPVIVSLTPLPLSADSRTLKQVISVHRFGFRSVVIEGEKSQLASAEVPIEVISSLDCAKSGASAPEVGQGDPGRKEPSSPSSESTAAPRISTFLRLRESSVGRFFRRWRGTRAIAGMFVPALDRFDQAAVSCRGSGSIAGVLSIRAVVVAVPAATFMTLKAIARGAATKLPNWAFYHPSLFAEHLAVYLNKYFFSVLAVAPRADVYYLHAFYQFPAVWFLSLRYRAKVIYDAHDFYSQLEDDGSLSPFWKNWVMPFERFIERLCVRFADDVVTVNDGIAALMRERFGCDAAIVRNAHDLRLDRELAGTIREAIDLPVEAFLVVSIGNWKPGMAMEQMFDALSRLPEHVHLAFLGGGYPPLDDAIKSRGIDGRVHVLPPVLPQEVVPFISSADASVVLYYGKSPNYQNALPNRFFQSIAARLPLVYPDLAEIRRLADRYGVGLMADPRDPSQIELALRSFVENRDQCVAIRRNLDLASRELCWEREERVLRGLLHRNLGKAEASCSAVESETIG